MATPINLPDILQSIQAPSGSDPRDVQQAKDALSIEYTPQISGIRSAIQQIQGLLDQDTLAQQKYGQVADQKIMDIGSQLASTLQQNAGAIGNIYQAGQQQVGAAYDQAFQTLGSVGGNVQQNLVRSAQGLGQTQALEISQNPFDLDPLSRIKGSMATLQGQTAVGKAGATSNLAALGTQMQAIAQKAVGDSEQNYAQKRTDLVRNVLKTIGELTVQTNTKTQDLIQQFATLAATAAPKFRQLVTQAATARTAAERQVALDNFKQQLDLAKLDISNQRLDVARQQAANTGTNNDLLNQIRQQDLISKTRGNEEAAANAQFVDLQGDKGLTAWLSQTNKTGLFKGAVRRLIQQAVAEGGTASIDPYAYSLKLVQDNAKKGKISMPDTAGKSHTHDVNDVINAINVYFNKQGKVQVGKVKV